MKCEEEPVPATRDSRDVPLGRKSSAISGPAGEPAHWNAEAPAGLLIINADDWGGDRETTERTFECILRGAVSSVSAMVFMEDSERAAAIARERGIDAGLHLNFTTPFSAPASTTGVVEHQRRVSRFLQLGSLAQIVFHPGLKRSFEYLVAAQRDEF